MGGVRGILLDSSVILAAGDGDDNGNASLRAGADYLLRKLHYSKIPTGISYGPHLPTPKVALLEKMASLYSVDCFILNPSAMNGPLDNLSLAWTNNGGSFVYVVSSCNEELSIELGECGWLIIFIGSGATASKNTSMLVIEKLQELPLAICNLHREGFDNDNVVVGYIMKPSREEDFAKRGAFPLSPTQNGLIFVPLTFELPISSQVQHTDIVLHKATDEIMSVEMGTSLEFCDKVTYTKGMQELKRYIESQQDFCVVDPFDNIFPVLDRLKIQQILLGLENINVEGHCKIRPPYFLKVNSFCESNLVRRLGEAQLSLPSIVKPQVACGVADAHSMAIVFRDDDYKDLSVPLPAIVQEYVDHSASLFKFYVLGEKVFYAVKKSTPNAETLMKLSERTGFKPLLFDSLKSLPIGIGEESEGGRGNDEGMDLKLVTEAARWLRGRLDLTIFGFDVVIQEGSGDHVIVDVNYLPSFKEVADDVAIPAFWEAIKMKYQQQIKRPK